MPSPPSCNQNNCSTGRLGLGLRIVWMMAMDLLRLIALDREDIEVVSAHLQDAIVKVGDVHWRPNEKRFVLGVNRFDWESALAADALYRRRLAALRFDRVLSCQVRNIDPRNRDAMLNLLAIDFAPKDGPSAAVTLVFSGGGAIRLELECLEAELADLGPTWTCARCPEHQLEVTEASAGAGAGVDAAASPRH